MAHDHHHKFDPANAARLDDPRRRELLPPERLAALLAVRDGERVADVGSGTGFWLAALLDAAPPGARFVALDVEPAMLAHLQARLRDHPRRADVTLVRSTEDALPLPDGSLDGAVLGMVYHELADRRAFLAELRRVLAPGGRLAIVDWDVVPPGTEPAFGPPAGHRVPPATVLAELEAAGFVDAARPDPYRDAYVLLARAPLGSP